MNRLIKLPTPAKLSCLVGNLFTELELPCDVDIAPKDALVLCGRTAADRDAMLMICKNYCLFVGDPADLDAAQNGQCPNRGCPYG